MFGDCAIDRHHHAARVAVEAERLAVVADPLDRVADEVRDVDVGLGGDLTGDDAEARREQRLARDTTHRVLGEDRVEDGVGDLVGHLVGMALRDGLGGEGPAAHALRSCSRMTRHDRVEHRSGHGTLVSQADILLDPLTEDHDLVGVVLEPGAGRRDVVGDDQVEVLAPELALGVLAERLGLGREPDQRLTRALRRSEASQDVGGRLEDDLGRPAFLLDLVVDRGLRPEVRDGRGHDDDIRRRRAGQDGGLHLGGSLDRDDLGTRGHRPADSRDDGDRRAASCRFESQRMPLLSRRPVRDHAHRIDRLSCAARGHQHAQPGHVLRREHALDVLDDRLGAREPPGPDVAARETSGLGVDDAHAARAAGSRGFPAPTRAPTSRCASLGTR